MINVTEDCPIGETRWWAKDQALTKVFGCFGKPQDALYVDLLLTLSSIEEDTSMKPTVRVKAKGYIEALLKYETILTAQTFLLIFEHTSPLSKYLQIKGMNILAAQHLVEGTKDSLNKFIREFEGVKVAADEFVIWANQKLQEEDSIEIEVQTALPEKRVRKNAWRAFRRQPSSIIRCWLWGQCAQCHSGHCGR